VSDATSTVEVPIWSLDTLLSRHKIDRIRLLKIDVEGYELAVLKGVAASLQRVENVIFEALPDLPVEQTNEIKTLLTSQNFSFFTIAGSPWEVGRSLPESNVWARR
jgi:hypothetical protein